MLTPSGVGLGLFLLAATTAVIRWTETGDRIVGVAFLVLAVASAYGARCVEADDGLVQAANAELDRLALCDDANANAPADSDFRGAYLGLLAWERANGVTCPTRRIFTTSRWDFPLELQSPRFVNQVFDVRGPSFNARLLA